MTRGMIGVAALAVNLLSIPTLAHDLNELDACYVGLGRITVEAPIIRKIERNGGHLEVTVNKEALAGLSPDNRAFVVDCIDMITSVDESDPDTWPYRPELDDEPIVNKDSDI